jgi:hypothetical protein
MTQLSPRGHGGNLRRGLGCVCKRINYSISQDFASNESALHDEAIEKHNLNVWLTAAVSVEAKDVR